MKNMLIKVLSVAMALTMIMGAFATIVSAADVNIVDHKHNWVKVDHVDATCITPGYDIYECECGEARTQAVEDVLAVCSEKTLVTVEKTAPTCTAPGYLEYTSCVLCGKEWGNNDENIDPENPKALGHDWEVFVVDPECGVEGEIYRQCKVCSAKETYENITACPDLGGAVNPDNEYCTVAGHKNFSYVIKEQPTCTENGWASFECAEENCDAFVRVTILAPGHNWQVVVGEDADKNALPYNLTKIATCESNGYRAYECLYCDAEANDKSEENKANVEAINAALKKAFTDDKGNFSATAYWAVAAGDLGAYADIDATKIDANVKAAYVGGHILVDLVSPTYNGTTMTNPGDAKCDCVLSYDNDGNGKLDFATDVIKFYEEPTCSQEGFQWKHCVRVGCTHGKTTSGETTHYMEKVAIPKKDDHVWETTTVLNDKNESVTVLNYFYLLKYVDANGNKVEINVRATSLKDAKDKMIAKIKAENPADATWNDIVAFGEITWKHLQCTTAINGYAVCVYCGWKNPVAEQTEEATGHDYDTNGNGTTDDDVITKLDPDHIAGNIAICDPSAHHTVQYKCVNCTELTKETAYVVDHVYYFTCDDADCDSNKEHKDDKGNVYFVDCKDCTHAGRKYECKRCETYVAKEAEYANNQHFDAHKLVITEEKVAYYTLEGIGKVYETCVLPARYVWACTNTNCDYTETHFNPADFTKGDAIWEDLDNDGVLDFNEEGADITSIEEIMKVISRGNANKVSKAVTAHRPYDETSNNGVKYIAPTCKTNGSAIGFCTWCSKNVNETLPKGEQYHVYVLVAAAVQVNCMTTGYTAKYECSVCGDVKGGEAIDFDPTKHSHVEGCVKELFKSRPATCTIAYSEVYLYSKCGRYETVTAGQVNPTNHVYYDYDNNFDVIKITSFLKTIDAVAPECTIAGNHSFTYCTECNYVVSVDTENCVYDDHRTYDADKKVWNECGKSTAALNDAKNEKFHGLCAYTHCKNHADVEKYSMVLDTDNKADTTSKIELAYAANADQFENLANGLTVVVDDFGKAITAKEVEAFAKANHRLTEVAGVKLTDKEGATATTNNITDAVFAIAELGHNFWFNTDTTTANTLSAEAWVAAGNTAEYPGRVLRVLLKETCTTPGHEWKIACSRSCCDEIADNEATKDIDESQEYTIHTELNGETVLPHGIEKVFRNDISKEATCLEGGLIAGLFCPLCPAANDPHAPAEDASSTNGISNGCAICEGPEPQVKALGHKQVPVKSASNDGIECLTYSVTFYKCERCDDLTDTNGDLLWVGKDWIPAYEEHVYAKGADGKTDVVVYVKETCTEDGYKYKTCTVCDEDVIVEVVPAHGHRNVNYNDDVNGDGVVNAYDGDVITFDCKNSAYLINKGTDCDICGKIVAVDANKNVICGAQNGQIDHKWVKTYVSGGCVTDGGYSYICSDCGITKNDAVHNFVNGVCACGAEESDYEDVAHGHHDYGTTIQYTPATPEATGIWEWECRRCGAIISEKLIYTRDIEFALSAKGLYSEVVVNGGKLEVTLSISTEYLTFNTFYHTLNFNSAKLSIADADVEFLFDFDRSMSQVNDGSVVVAAWYDFSNTELLDGEAIDVVKYVFDVAPGVSTVEAVIDLAQTAKVSSDVAVYEPTYEYFDDIEVALVGDITKDDEFDAEDVKKFSDIIKHNGNCEGCDDELCGYNALADVVYDGVIDSADWFAFTAFALSNQTIADFYAMFNVDVYAMIEAYEVDDYNGDDDITAKDRKMFNDLLIETVEEAYGAYDAYEINLGDFSVLLEMADEYLSPDLQ